MSAQEMIVFALGAAAVGYLALRVLRRRRAGTCCGARTCPAAADLLRRLERERAAPGGGAAAPEPSWARGVAATGDAPGSGGPVVTGLPPRVGIGRRPN